jgi:flavin reductase (DIM6/NTAB) family NADH-FMN oxidoreductase RutF
MPEPAGAADAIDPARLRRAFGMYATGVTVITAIHPAQGPVGITANSFSSVSLDPPLLLFSLSRQSFSLRPLLESRDGQHALSHRFAAGGGEKWSGLTWREGRHGAPILGGTIASFECAHHAQYDGGDHVIVLGRVLALDTDAGGEPLLYFHSRYRSIGEEVDSDV